MARSWLKLIIVNMNPAFSSPIRFAHGTRTCTTPHIQAHILHARRVHAHTCRSMHDLSWGYTEIFTWDTKRLAAKRHCHATKKDIVMRRHYHAMKKDIVMRRKKYCHATKKVLSCDEKRHCHAMQRGTLSSVMKLVWCAPEFCVSILRTWIPGMSCSTWPHACICGVRMCINLLEEEEAEPTRARAASADEAGEVACH